MKQRARKTVSLPATKGDLSDMRDQLLDAISGKLIAQERNILEAMDSKLATQKEAIVKDVADFIVDTVVPLIDKQDGRITHIESRLDIPRVD